MSGFEKTLIEMSKWLGGVLQPLGRVFGNLWGPWVVSLGCLVLLAGVEWLVYYVIWKKVGKRRVTSNLFMGMVSAVANPLGVLAMLGLFYAAFSPLFSGKFGNAITVYGARGMKYVVFVVFYWLLYRVVCAGDVWLKQWAKKTKTALDDILAPLPAKVMQWVMPIFALEVGRVYFNFSERGEAVVQMVAGVMLVLTVSWFLTQMVMLADKIILVKYRIDASDNLAARKIHTQIRVLQRIAYFLIGIFTLASVLMLFDKVRQLGTTILTSAGVVGVIFGLAAQKTLGNLLAGTQLAFTQPIRLDDVVMVENEWGKVEEITLTYVVVRVWDERRLILPISYFIEKPFQNWTRTSSEIFGTVNVYVNYGVSVEAIRKEVLRVLKGNPLWNGKMCEVQVTDLKETMAEVRVLVSANTATKLWDLKCGLREELMKFIQKRS